MSAQSSSSKNIADIFDDDFDSYLQEAQQNPEFRAAFEDAQGRNRLLDSLVKLRRILRLTQKQVADRMGVRQPTVAGFEKESSDPKLSTVQRYARAVEAQLTFSLAMPADCDWVSPASRAYRPVSVPVKASRISAHENDLSHRWMNARQPEAKYHGSRHTWALVA